MDQYDFRQGLRDLRDSGPEADLPIDALLTRVHRHRVVRTSAVSLVGAAAATGLVLGGITAMNHEPDRPVAPAHSTTQAPAPTAPPTPTPPTATPAGLDGWPLWSTVPVQTVDLDTAPSGHVSQALAVVVTPDVANENYGGLVYALDASTKAWVRVELPEGVPDLQFGLSLSADGRSIAYLGLVGPVQELALIDLASGTSRILPIPTGGETDCFPSETSFSPDGEHLAVLSGCQVGLSTADPAPTSTVSEVALSTGAVRQIGTLEETEPSQLPAIAYSPDGSLLAVRTATLEPDRDDLSVIVVLDRNGTERARWNGALDLWTAPWQDDHTLVGAESFFAPIDENHSSVTRVPTSFDVATGRSAPLSADVGAWPGLALVSHGMVVTSDTNVPPTAVVSVTDPATGRAKEWLTMTSTGGVLHLLLPSSP